MPVVISKMRAIVLQKVVLFTLDDIINFLSFCDIQRLWSKLPKSLIVLIVVRYVYAFIASIPPLFSSLIKIDEDINFSQTSLTFTLQLHVGMSKTSFLIIFSPYDVKPTKNFVYYPVCKMHAWSFNLQNNDLLTWTLTPSSLSVFCPPIYILFHY